MKRPFSYDHTVKEWAGVRRVEITMYDAVSTKLFFMTGTDKPGHTGPSVDEALALADMLVKASRGGPLRRAWHWFLAFTRIDLELVCALSRGKGLVDFHDYPDTEHGQPWAMGTDKCARCGKEFSI